MAKVEFSPTKEQLSMVGDHAASGKRFDLMATFEAKEDGSWCLVAIEDSQMPGYGDDQAKDEYGKPKNKFTETYEKARAGEPMEAGY